MCVQHDHGGGLRGFQALLGAGRWHELRSLGASRAHRRGSFLLRQGESGDHVLALTQGRVKVLGMDADGSQVLVAFRGAGDLIGEMAVRSGARSATVQALDHCTAWHIPGDAFEEFLRQHDAQSLFADYLVTKLSETVAAQLQQAHFTPLQRISRLLLDVLKLADEDQTGCMRIPLSQEAIASALGLARSTIAEQIAVLRRSHTLEPGPRLVVANPERLARCAEVSAEF